MTISHYPGERFGKLITIERITRNKLPHWICKCDCGDMIVVLATNLYGGNTRSCGCLRSESASKWQRERYGNYKEILRYYRRNAKIKGRKILLTEDQFVELLTQNCFYCGQAPVQRKIGYAPSNGIDRLENDKDYTLENCVSCCSTCNWAKNRLNKDEFYEWISKVHNHLSKSGVI